MDNHLQSYLKNQQIGVTVNDMLLLRTVSSLRADGKNTTSEIAKKIGVTSAAISISIKRLEKKMFLHRYHDIDDRRRVYIGLTKNAHQHLKNFIKFYDKTIDSLFSSIHHTEMKNLINTLIVIENNSKTL